MAKRQWKRLSSVHPIKSAARRKVLHRQPTIFAPIAWVWAPNWKFGLSPSTEIWDAQIAPQLETVDAHLSEVLGPCGVE